MLIVTVHSVNCVRHITSFKPTGGVWATRPFTNWKKAVEKKKAHASSDGHIQANQAVLAHLTTQHTAAGSVIQKLQNVTEQE